MSSFPTFELPRLELPLQRGSGRSNTFSFPPQTFTSTTSASLGLVIRGTGPYMVSFRSGQTETTRASWEQFFGNQPSSVAQEAVTTVPNAPPPPPTFQSKQIIGAILERPDQESCLFCFEDFADTATQSTMFCSVMCGTKFHEDCLVRYYDGGARKCPHCRAEMFHGGHSIDYWWDSHFDDEGAVSEHDSDNENNARSDDDNDDDSD